MHSSAFLSYLLQSLSCTRCRVRHCLPVSSEALHAAEEVVRQIEAHGRLDFDVPLEEANPLYSADYVWTKGSGRMLGVLIASEGEGVSTAGDDVPQHGVSSAGLEEVPLGVQRLRILKAFSGQLTGSWLVPG